MHVYPLGLFTPNIATNGKDKAPIWGLAKWINEFLERANIPLTNILAGKAKTSIPVNFDAKANCPNALKKMPQVKIIIVRYQ